MVWCDTNPNILSGSDEILHIYVDGRTADVSRLYMTKLRTTNGKVKRYVVEVKPLAQCREPKRPKREQTKKYIYLNEVKTYTINQASGKQQLTFVKTDF